MTNVEELKAGLRAAFDAGYRFIDTAYIYYNESIIGEVLQEYYDSGKLRRADVFICSKVLAISADECLVIPFFI